MCLFVEKSVASLWRRDAKVGVGSGRRVQVEPIIFLSYKWDVVEEYRFNLLSFSSFYLLSGTWLKSTG